MKTIIYARVSSSSQVEGTSLDEQIRKCEKYCEDKEIEVSKIFIEKGESAKSANRTEFLKAISYASNKDNQVGMFLVYKIDRFSRNTTDHFAVKKLLSDGGVELVSVSEPISSDPAGKVMETMLAAFAEFDNAIRTQRSKEGMSAKINQGIYPWFPPAGYKPLGSKKMNKKKDQPDPINEDTFPIIQQGLKEFAQGGMTKMELHHRLIALGINKVLKRKIGNNYVYRMFEDNKRMRFYTGYLWNPFENREVKGKHVPMLTEKEYDQIQLVLSGKKINKFERKYQRFNPAFPLRGTVLCMCCEGSLTGSASTNGSGKKYYYYHCENKSCDRKGKTIKKIKLEDQFSSPSFFSEHRPRSIKCTRVFSHAKMEAAIWCCSVSNERSRGKKRLFERKEKEGAAYDGRRRLLYRKWERALKRNTR